MQNLARTRTLSRQSSVAALIPHFRCEEWLADCLESLVAQTRPLDAIVVIDDCSEIPPVGIVRRFPQVTLLAASQNVGPYRLIQQVINETAYHGYLFNDADDWSARNRLEILLAEAERTGAELIGCQEVRVLCEHGDVKLMSYPLDVNEALSRHPTCHPLLHPTSVVARNLVMGLGGFATGMRFSGDVEFVRRAVHKGVVVNAPQYCYFRRERKSSLTSSSTTGLKTPARVALREALDERSTQNAIAVNAGRNPDLTPYLTADAVGLKHICGPTPKFAEDLQVMKVAS